MVMKYVKIVVESVTMAIGLVFIFSVEQIEWCNTFLEFITCFGVILFMRYFCSISLLISGN